MFCVVVLDVLSRGEAFSFMVVSCPCQALCNSALRPEYVLVTDVERECESIVFRITQ